MQTIDEIKIEGDEDGFHLIVHTDDGDRHEYRIGLPDQIKQEVDRTIGRWLAEGETARLSMPYDTSSAYEHTDPKHPNYYDNMTAQVDRMRELFRTGSYMSGRDH